MQLGGKGGNVIHGRCLCQGVAFEINGSVIEITDALPQFDELPIEPVGPKTR